MAKSDRNAELRLRALEMATVGNNEHPQVTIDRARMYYEFLSESESSSQPSKSLPRSAEARSAA